MRQIGSRKRTGVRAVSSESPVLAAGAVCWKVTPKGKLRILLVRRTQHGDVSLPEGQGRPGRDAARRPRCARSPRRPASMIGARRAARRRRVPAAERPRQDRATTGRPRCPPLAIANSTFVSNDEIEELDWVSIEKARRILSYPHDVDIVDRFAELYDQGRARTFAIIALRHGKAMPPEAWDGPDATRPLLQRGVDQAVSVAHGVAAFRPARLISSTAERCLRTIAPTARLTGLDVRENVDISQDAYRADAARVEKVVAKRLQEGRDGRALQPRSRAARRSSRAIARATGTTGQRDAASGRVPRDRRVRGAARPGRPPRERARRRRDPRTDGLEQPLVPWGAHVSVRGPFTFRSPFPPSLVHARS